MTFFPQLIAGPIVTYSEMMPQFRAERSHRLTADNLAVGIYIFVIGLFKKIVVADTLAIFADNGFGMSAGLGLAAAWATSLSYTFQIYFDFSGYSDMALGLGRMLNINLPSNFNSPYKSEGMGEFWRRWHMTLGRALSTFIYRPLGGNRKGKFHTYMNLFITFFISGLWHGAAWTFVIWGTLHGLFVVLDRMLSKSLQEVPRYIKIAGTFIVVNFLWVLFRAPSFNVAMDIYMGMLRFRNIGLAQLRDVAFDGIINFPQTIWILYISVTLTMCLLICFFSKNTIENAERFSRHLTLRSVITTTAMFVLSVISLSRMSVFIYFNF